jgi:sugar lactone lactonase YvrE
VTTPSTEAKVLLSPDTEPDRFLPEGPREVTVGGRLALAWVNIQTAPDATAGDIHLRFWDTGEHRKLPQPARPGFLLPTDRADVVLAGREKEVGTLDLRTGDWQALARIPDDNPRTIINDGEVVPGGGAVVFGTKDVRFADPIAALYLFTPADNRLSLLAGGQVCSNGKVFAGSGSSLTLHDIDTPRRAVTRYRLDLASRTLADEGTVIDLRDRDGFPDGMADAGDGTVVIAMYNPSPVAAGRAYRFRLSDGALVEEWTTPGSPRVTCPLLVRRDGGVKLVLTTAVEGMPADQRRQAPEAGSHFIADTALAALPLEERVRLG